MEIIQLSREMMKNMNSSYVQQFIYDYLPMTKHSVQGVDFLQEIAILTPSAHADALRNV